MFAGVKPECLLEHDLVGLQVAFPSAIRVLEVHLIADSRELEFPHRSLVAAGTGPAQETYDSGVPSPPNCCSARNRSNCAPSSSAVGMFSGWAIRSWRSALKASYCSSRDLTTSAT